MQNFFSLDSYPVTNFEIDSRRIEKGGLFFALKGEKVDGHLYLREAAKKGAVGAMVSKDYSGDNFGLRLFAVDDVAEELRLLAKKKIERLKPEIIGVTGSVGKTTTKEFIFSLLDGSKNVQKSLKNFNSQVGLPVAILNMQEPKVMVLEMGMSFAGEISKLIEMAPPTFAIITRVCLCHVINFRDGEEGIAKAKAEILESRLLKEAVINLETAEKFKTIFGVRKTASYSMEKREANFYWQNGTVFENGKEAAKIDPPFKESHLLENLLGAMSVLRVMGIEWQKIRERIKKISLPKMRFEKIEKEGIIFINDAYNANPVSMRTAIENMPQGRAVFVLGAMKELGKFSSEAHLEMASLAKSKQAKCFFLGEEWQAAKKLGIEICFSHEEIADNLNNILQRGDVVLVKGSRSMAMEKIFDLLKFSS